MIRQLDDSDAKVREKALIRLTEMYRPAITERIKRRCAGRPELDVDNLVGEFIYQKFILKKIATASGESRFRNFLNRCLTFFLSDAIEKPLPNTGLLPDQQDPSQPAADVQFEIDYAVNTMQEAIDRLRRNIAGDDQDLLVLDSLLAAPPVSDKDLAQQLDIGTNAASARKTRMRKRIVKSLRAVIAETTDEVDDEFQYIGRMLRKSGKGLNF